MLSYTYWCIANRHTHKGMSHIAARIHVHRHTHTHTQAHGASQEATGPVGQSLRVWFVCLDLIIETGLFLQPPLLFFIFLHEGRREGA